MKKKEELEGAYDKYSRERVCVAFASAFVVDSVETAKALAADNGATAEA